MKRHTGNQTPQSTATAICPEVRGRNQQEATVTEKRKCLHSRAANPVQKRKGREGKREKKKKKGTGHFEYCLIQKSAGQSGQ